MQNSQKIAFLFPGQGAQKIGMLRDFYENFSQFREIFSKASDILSYDFHKLVYEDNIDINQTRFTQLAILLVELGCIEIVKSLGINPSFLAGYSLGEYSCLYAANSLSLEDVIKIVNKRALFMQEDTQKVNGGMLAVIGVDTSLIKEKIKDLRNVWIANYNSSSQVSISGEKEAVLKAQEILKKIPFSRVIPVNVSGSFHTPLLEGASQKLSKELESYVFSNPQVPYYSNTRAKKVYKKEEIKELLSLQIKSPVLWSSITNSLVNEDLCPIFVELGPGKVLRGFMREYSSKGIKLFAFENLQDLENLQKELS